MNENFKKINKNNFLYQFYRSDRFPMDPDSVVTSYNDLKNMLTDVNRLYPGQIVALADDIQSSDGIKVASDDRQHMGLYWVTNSTEKNPTDYNTLTTYKLATQYETDVKISKVTEDVEKNITPKLDSITSYAYTSRNMLNALVTPAEYYKPDSSCVVMTNIAKTVAIGGKLNFADNTITCVWGKNKPSYHTAYIYKYIGENNALPAGVALSDLGYTQAMQLTKAYIDGATQYYSDNLSDYNIKTAKSITFDSDTPSISTISYALYYAGDTSHTGTDKLNPLYTNNGDTASKSFNFAFYNNNGLPNKETTYIQPCYETKYMAVGKYVLMSVSPALTLYYAPPQITYSSQLAADGIYVTSDKKAWTGTNSITVTGKLEVNVGYRCVYGMFGLKSDVQVDANIMTAVINKSTHANLCNGAVYKSSVVTCETNGGYLDKNATDRYFMYNTFGASSQEYKPDDANAICVFFGFPTGHFTATPKSGTSYWTQRTAVSEPRNTFPGSSTDPKNYAVAINISNYEITNNINVNYTFYIAKTSVSSFTLSGPANDAGVSVGIKLQLNSNSALYNKYTLS